MNIFVNKKIISLMVFIGALACLAVLPVLAMAAAEPLVPCGNTVDDICTFQDIFVLIGRVIKFMLFTLALPLCAIAIVWGGITIVLNPANSGARTKGLDMIKNACIGLALALASYLIVDTLLTTFSTKTLRQLEQDANINSGPDTGG